MDTMPQPRKVALEEELTNVEKAIVLASARALWLRVAVVCGTTFACGFGLGAWLF